MPWTAQAEPWLVMVTLPAAAPVAPWNGAAVSARPLLVHHGVGPTGTVPGKVNGVEASYVAGRQPIVAVLWPWAVGGDVGVGDVAADDEGVGLSMPGRRAASPSCVARTA